MDKKEHNYQKIVVILWRVIYCGNEFNILLLSNRSTSQSAYVMYVYTDIKSLETLWRFDIFSKNKGLNRESIRKIQIPVFGSDL